MKILMITTGGTISCLVENGIISKANKTPLLVNMYKEKTGEDIDIDIKSPVDILSENSTLSSIKKITDCVNKYASSAYDGIIITHGTDSLAYTSAAVSFSIVNKEIPVCIVSSNRPIGTDGANGYDNFACAVRIIKSKISGVYVPYRNSDGKMYIHGGAFLVGMAQFSEDLYGVYSKEEEEFFEDGTSFGISTKEPKKVNDNPKNKTVILKAYPGMAYYVPDDTENVVMECYHSGTLDTESRDAVAFYSEAKKRNIRVYATGMRDGSDRYESTKRFEELGIVPIYDIPASALYISLTMDD